MQFNIQKYTNKYKKLDFCIRNIFFFYSLQKQSAEFKTKIPIIHFCIKHIILCYLKKYNLEEKKIHRYLSENF